MKFTASGINLIKIRLIRVIILFSAFRIYVCPAQSTRLFVMDINSGRVLLDTFDLKSKTLKTIDTLKFKFDAFSTYDRTYDSRNANYLLECDTAIIIVNSNGTLNKTIHKPYDVEGMEYDPVNDRVYCSVLKNNSYYFAYLNIASGAFTVIRSLSDNRVHHSTLDYDNRYYYIISDTRGLLKINMLTGIKEDSVKYFTTNNCMCNEYDIETGKIATTCRLNGQYLMQLYTPLNKSFQTIDTLGNYGTGFFSYESSALDQNNGNWYLNLGKKIGLKNIRTNSKMDTFVTPFNRIRSLALDEKLCYRPMSVDGFALQNPRCSNGSDGFINLKLTGGRRPYFYSINNIYDTFSLRKNLKEGNYILFAKDKNGFCTMSVAADLISPPQYANSLGLVHNTCYNATSGSITIHARGALSPYAYAWNGSPFINDSVFSGLVAGSYSIYVKDRNDCLDTLKNIEITSPSALIIDSLKLNNIKCFGEKNGEAAIYLSGALAPYAISLDSVNFIPVRKLTGLNAGTYQLYARDKNNCIIKETIAITEPLLFKTWVVVRNSQCYGKNNGTAKVNVSGGNVTDKYWLNIKGQSKKYLIDDTIRFLKPGYYGMIIKNQNNCMDSLDFSISEPALFEIGQIKDTTLCNGQQIKVNKHHADAVSYLTYSNTGIHLSADSFILDKAGIYYFEASNSSNCKSRDTFTIYKINMDVTHDFLLPSVAFLSDTVYAVNISRPLPDKSFWQLDKSISKQMVKDNYTLGMLFKDTGIYHITLQSKFRSCGFNLVKQILIRSAFDSSAIDAKYGYKGPMIQKFEVYANPHDGQHFKIRIQLRDTVPFSVYKIDPSTGYIIGEMDFINLKSHEFTAFTSTRSEVYYLKLIVGRESKVVKVVAVYE